MSACINQTNTHANPSLHFVILCISGTNINMWIKIRYQCKEEGGFHQFLWSPTRKMRQRRKNVWRLHNFARETTGVTPSVLLSATKRREKMTKYSLFLLFCLFVLPTRAQLGCLLGDVFGSGNTAFSTAFSIVPSAFSLVPSTQEMIANFVGASVCLTSSDFLKILDQSLNSTSLEVVLSASGSLLGKLIRRKEIEKNWLMFCLTKDFVLVIQANSAHFIYRYHDGLSVRLQ